MTYLKPLLTAMAVSLLALGSAHAETVHTKTYVQTQDIEDVDKVNFSQFDTNQDGSYSMVEVGERLFTSFDRDGNEVIDNQEWDNPAVLTVIPMEAETFTFIDTNNDGVTDQSMFTYETFYKASGLMKFDDTQNGLSAHEFIDEEFKIIDINDDKVIDIEEWKEVYLNSRMSHEEADAYNK